MEVRSQNKKLTTTVVKKPTAKLEKHSGKENNEEVALSSLVNIVQQHYSSYLLRGTVPGLTEFRKFVTLLYRGLFYSFNNLKGPSDAFIKKKKVVLKETPEDNKKKILLLDLDETLIHSVFTNEKTDVSFTSGGEQFRFNVRPGCLQFLETMAQHYYVCVFTAGTQDYAEPIVEYLNSKKKTISGLLHRKNCMETHNGFFIKDLRIVSNRDLKDLIIVDNLVHSFGLQITNGVPILEFTNNKTDRELLGITKLLVDLSTVEDVRPVLEEKLGLKKILDISETDFIEVGEDSRI